MPLSRRSVHIAGAFGALVPLAITQLALAPNAGAATDPRNNDWGQTADQIAAEIAAQANETPAVVAAVRTVTNAQHKVTTLTAAQSQAKKNLNAAKKVKGPARKARVTKATKRLKATTTALRNATTALAQAQAALAAARTAARSDVAASHFVPVDGTWTGALATYWIEGQTEPMQVRIVVSNGHVSAVDVPVYQHLGDSGQFNALALPTLITRALAAHDTAQVAGVSGASLTSMSFRQSLQSALIQAGFPL